MKIPEANCCKSKETFDFHSFLLGSVFTMSLSGLSYGLGARPLVEIPTQIILSSILLVITLVMMLHYYRKTRCNKSE